MSGSFLLGRIVFRIPGAGGCDASLRRSRPPTSERLDVLLPLVVSLGFALAGAAVIAKVTQLTARRLGLDFFSVLEWFGLAEARLQQRALRVARH
jgi:hypothetical protein